MVAVYLEGGNNIKFAYIKNIIDAVKFTLHWFILIIGLIASICGIQRYGNFSRLEIMMIFNFLGLAVIFISLFRGFYSLEKRLEEIKQILSNGFQKIFELKARKTNPGNPVYLKNEEHLERKKQKIRVKPSGMGAFSGMVIGGGIGTLVSGSIGTIIGGIVGALIGNQMEYEELKKK